MIFKLKNKFIKSIINTDRSTYCVWLLGITIICIDRITKLCALEWLSEQPYWVNSFLSYELVMNRGFSWGMFHSGNTWQFIGVTMVIGLVTAFMVWQTVSMAKKGLSVIGHVCIIAGSFSNLFDRVWYAGVIDFIVLSYHNYSWPVFNVADIAVVVGVCLVMMRDDIWK